MPKKIKGSVPETQKEIDRNVSSLDLKNEKKIKPVKITTQNGGQAVSEKFLRSDGTFDPFKYFGNSDNRNKSWSSEAPVVVSYGGGTNSIAMLIEMQRLGFRVDQILFADTGGERPETYAYVNIFSEWLKDRGYPEILTVRRVNRAQEVITFIKMAKKTRDSLIWEEIQTCTSQ